MLISWLPYIRRILTFVSVAGQHGLIANQAAAVDTPALFMNPPGDILLLRNSPDRRDDHAEPLFTADSLQ